MRSFYLLCEEPRSLTINGLGWVVISTVDSSQVMSKVLHWWGFVYLHSSQYFVEENEDHDDPD